MKASIAGSLLLASLAAAQSTVSLTQALTSQNSSLSALIGLLQSQPDLVSSLNSATNITILAPSNDALAKFLNSTTRTAQIAANPGLLPALLSYHVLQGTYFGSNFTNSSMFIPTLLANETYANVTGGQRVQALLQNGTVTFFSALKENSTVVTPNVNFTGGTIHIINSVLTMPTNINTTLGAANLTATLGAIRTANVTDVLDHLKDVTVFAPSNDAFNNIGNITASITTQQLGNILNYHVIPGKVEYSNMLTNTTLVTAAGNNVTISQVNGTFYVNSAKIIIQDVLVSNGVVHVIDNVLNPSNSTATPNASGGPAFSGAGPATTGIPFTSGIPAPTSTSPVVTSANPGGVSKTSTSSQLAPAAMRTGAVGAAALFGGAAAALMNM